MALATEESSLSKEIPSSRDLQAELERSRESSFRLLDSLAQKVGASSGAVRNAASGVQRAATFVHGQSVKEVAKIHNAVRKRPTAYIFIAAAAGFLVGLAVRGQKRHRVLRLW
jgi:ElaB/YqjD/DUF883 family membrane-anchored ribosome-binding protein